MVCRAPPALPLGSLDPFPGSGGFPGLSGPWPPTPGQPGAAPSYVKNATDFQSPNDTTIGQPPQSPQRPQPRPGIVAFSLKKEAICQAKGMLKGATPAKADARSENNTKMRRPKENHHTPLSARCCLAVSSMLWLRITRDNDYCPYDECYHTQPPPHPLPPWAPLPILDDEFP